MVSAITQVILGYMIFALTASSISMWLAAMHMRATLRGYIMSGTYMSAAVIIYYNTALYDSVASVGALMALVGPWAYHRIQPPKD